MNNLKVAYAFANILVSEHFASQTVREPEYSRMCTYPTEFANRFKFGWVGTH